MKQVEILTNNNQMKVSIIINDASGKKCPKRTGIKLFPAQ